MPERMTPAEYRAANKRRLDEAVAAGELEPTKAYTLYVCPNPECGRTSTWIGSLGPDRCFDGYSIRFRQDSERSIRQQFDGLHALMAEGELIRNVRVSVVLGAPIEENITGEWEAQYARTEATDG